jgi:allene oxide cyclase-like protein
VRRIALASTAGALLLSAVSIAATSQSAVSSAAKPRTLNFDVQFSPFTLIPANPVRDPNSPFVLGDEIVFHDLLLSKGKQVGDHVGSCVIVAVTPEVLANCSDVMRLPGGTIAAQFANAPGPAPKALALTGGTGTYRNVGGEGSLVEFGNSKGSLTLDLLSFSNQGDGGGQQ